MRSLEGRVWRSRALREMKCREKDAVTRKIMGRLRIGPDFRAILMPCLHGIELGILEARGVSPDRIFAIERVDRNWQDMRREGRVTLTPWPMDASLAVDHIQADNPGGLDFIYGDFLGPPNFSHGEFLRKVFALRMIRPGGKLLLTFGLTRCRPVVKEWNDALLRAGRSEEIPTRLYVDAALEMTGHPRYRRFVPHPYRSRVGKASLRYVATEIDFP